MNNKEAISEKQNLANKKNAQSAGVKSKEGKDISKLNAMKHGCLTSQPLKNELNHFQEIKNQLESEFQPKNLVEHLYIERIAVHVLQLKRVSKATNEFNSFVDDPKIVESSFEVPIFGEVILNEGYKLNITPSSVETLLNIYCRYETAIENRLYKAVRELNKLRS